ncbi:hypothetical protein QBC39DRAFT_234841, partial [Podospora conica]
KVVLREGIYTTSPNDPFKRIYGYYKKTYTLYNKLFRYFKAYNDVKSIGNVKDYPDPGSLKIFEAPIKLIEEADNSPLSSYTYLRIKARIFLDIKDGEIYFNPGIRRLYIDKAFLKLI